MNQFNKKYSLIQTYALIVLDVCSIILSYLAAFLIRYRSFEDFSQKDVNWLVLLILICVLYSFLLDWNHFIFKRGYFEEMTAVLKYMVCLLIAIGFCVFLLRKGEVFSRLLFGIFGVLCAVLTYIFHSLFKKYMYHYYRKSNSSDKVLLVTESNYVEGMLADIKEEAAWSYEITAIALLDCEKTGQTCHGIPVLAGSTDLMEQIRQDTIDAALIYLPDAQHERIEGLVSDFETMGVDCHYCVSGVNRKVSVQSVGMFAGHLVVTYTNNTIDYRRRFIKRFLDIIGSIIGIIITAVLTPFIALAIKINSRGPVFFSQTRIGKNGRRFPMYKFRSMYIDAEERKKELMKQNEMQGLMFKMKDDPRITSVGRFLRKTSLDELPQFLNVLKGDMSLVGTRPPTCDEFEQYSLKYRRRLSITPGLTGMWQVSGRSDITDFDEVVKLDLQYIDNWSLSLDLKILLLTFGAVLFKRGSK